MKRISKALLVLALTLSLFVSISALVSADPIHVPGGMRTLSSPIHVPGGMARANSPVFAAGDVTVETLSSPIHVPGGMR